LFKIIRKTWGGIEEEKKYNKKLFINIISAFYLPTDAQESCFKKKTKIHIKTAPTCFGAVTIIRERISQFC
jgi:hypothetical protein